MTQRDDDLQEGPLERLSARFWDFRLAKRPSVGKGSVAASLHCQIPYIGALPMILLAIAAVRFLTASHQPAFEEAPIVVLSMIGSIAISAIAFLAATIDLRGGFGAMSRGELLSVQVAQAFARAGVKLSIGAAGTFVTTMALFTIVFFARPSDNVDAVLEQWLFISLGTMMLTVLLGGIFLVLAAAFREAVRIAREQDLTI